MKISVVIPLYNKEKYISRTLESVLKQTLPADEIVVIDDGSTDNSAGEVLRFVDTRIRLIHQQNSGEGAARNRGVKEAKHDLVAFLDADDEWKPDFLLHIQRLYNNFPDCGAYATAFEIAEPGGNKSCPAFAGIPSAPWIGIIPNFFRMMQYGNILSSSSVAIPKRVLLDLKGFPEGIIQGADRMLWVCLGMSYPIAYSPSLEVLIHGDATNRASTVFVSEPKTANLIDKMLRNQEVPLELVADVKDYNAYLKIQKVKHRVKAGQGTSARQLLITIKENKKYRQQVLLWYFFSFVPYPVLRLIQKARSS
jgi:glycosyltransferase involved in cell wall biosynthesis